MKNILWFLLVMFSYNVFAQESRVLFLGSTTLKVFSIMAHFPSIMAKLPIENETVSSVKWPGEILRRRFKSVTMGFLP